MTDRRDLRRLAGLLLAALLVLGACGSDDTSASDGDTAPENTATDDTAGDDTETAADDPAGDAEDVEADDPAGDAGPELAEPEADIAAARHCLDEGSGDAGAVLLVPGTGLTAADSYGPTLAPALVSAGYVVCTVDLVDTATGDIQRSAERVVAALRSMADEGHDDIALVGFSQGALASRWALTWWPDVRARVADFVSISGPHGGAAGAAPLCAEGCAAALHQLIPGSAFLTALDAAWEALDDSPSVTLLGSDADTVVSVAEAAIGDTTPIRVQDVCPDRAVDHVALLAEPVVHALVLDALAEDGPADPARLAADVCDGEPVAAEGWDPVAVTGASFGVILGATPEAAEPPLAAYAS